jgi:carbonic anhydrase
MFESDTLQEWTPKRERGAMATDKLLRGLKRFQERVYPKHRELFEKLALQQSPEVLLVTCADSRIDPCLLTQTKPGELFICRVIGNIVPRYPQAIGGVSATIEYAVGVLGVKDLIVCGHTDCGVMKGILNPEALKALPNVTAWLKHARGAQLAAKKEKKAPDRAELLLDLTEKNVVEQLKNLRTHPVVRARLEEGALKVHGWVYHIGPGMVTAWDEDAKSFVSADRAKEAQTQIVNLSVRGKFSRLDRR